MRLIFAADGDAGGVENEGPPGSVEGCRAGEGGDLHTILPPLPFLLAEDGLLADLLGVPGLCLAGSSPRPARFGSAAASAFIGLRMLVDAVDS